MKVLIAGLVWLGGSFAFAQAPDPRDSIILESKFVQPGAHPGSAADTAAYLYVRMYLTNKDTLAGITISLLESSVSGGAYAILGRPRTFDGTVNRLTNSFRSDRIARFAYYNSATPDSFVLSSYFNAALEDFEPPNAVRKPFWEIKFDSVLSNPGTVELDSVLSPLGGYFPIQFTNTVPQDLPVNFVKSIITVDPHPRGDLNYDFSLSPADVVWVLNCVMLGMVPPAGMAACDLNCDGQTSPADVVLELNAVFLGQPLPC